jgi:hypothetical protein
MQVVFIDNQAKSTSVKKLTEKGMELEYEPGHRPLGDKVTIDIFRWDDSPLAISGVSCRNVSDCLVLAENRAFSGAKVRYCCLEYVNLTDEQRRKLETLSGPQET